MFTKRSRPQNGSVKNTVGDFADSTSIMFESIISLYHTWKLSEYSMQIIFRPRLVEGLWSNALRQGVCRAHHFSVPIWTWALAASTGIIRIIEHLWILRRKMTENLHGLRNHHKVVDDNLIYISDKTSHAVHVRQFLDRYPRKKNIASRQRSSSIWNRW